LVKSEAKIISFNILFNPFPSGGVSSVRNTIAEQHHAISLIISHALVQNLFVCWSAIHFHQAITNPSFEVLGMMEGCLSPWFSVGRQLLGLYH